MNTEQRESCGFVRWSFSHLSWLRAFVWDIYASERGYKPLLHSVKQKAIFFTRSHEGAKVWLDWRMTIFDVWFEEGRYFIAKRSAMAQRREELSFLTTNERQDIHGWRESCGFVKLSFSHLSWLRAFVWDIYASERGYKPLLHSVN